MKKNILFLVFPLILSACGGDETSSSEKEENQEQEVVDEDVTTELMSFESGIEVESLNQPVDLDMDISQLSLSDIRILRNSFAAKQGYCFMKADLRAIFSTTSWYNKAMDDRFWKEEMGEDIGSISYTEEEKAFIDKLKKREEELRKQNLIKNEGKTSPKLDNIVNLFQLEEKPDELMQMLSKQGFAIVPNNNIQHFHVYEQNDYQQFPNFVTTDMYMQLFHMYFGFVLRTIEQDKFVPNLEGLTKNLHADFLQMAKNASFLDIKNDAEFAATYYAVAYFCLTGKELEVPESQVKAYKMEMQSINNESDDFSDLMDFKDAKFPYSLFKPRGHYTRNETLKRYFKGMMWLQTAPFCLDNDNQLLKAALLANVLKGNEEYLRKYRSVLEPVNFIIGLPDNVSILQLAEVMNKQDVNIEYLYKDEATFKKFQSDIKKIADQQNLINAKEQLSCPDKINFMPQRYLVDNEVMQELVDVESNKSKRAYPQGLDVMGVFGSVSAERILFEELKEDENWPAYADHFSRMKKKMVNVDWDASLYNSWIKSLLELQKKNKNYPYFMQTEQWDKKNLNASLASWAELKHDAILYAEQPMAAECGGGGPPDPITVGYVEPNVNYWNAVIHLLKKTEQVLKDNDLMTNEIKTSGSKLMENAQFLLSASKKELKGEKLTDQEYQSIEFIGSTYEWITLELVKQKDQYLDSWENITGPDKSVSIIADIYTSNASNNEDKGILHVGTGHVNDIYVVVEIEGYLYLTKGAVFSYHEFPLPLGNRLTDEEWQEMLKKNQAPDTPDWIKEIIVPIDAPKANEKIFYSSGC